MDQLINYDVVHGPTEDLTVYVAINRYKGFINNDPVNPDYIFDFESTVAEKAYEFTSLSGTGTLPLIETVFATIVDRPKPAYYWYIVEVYFSTDNNLLQVTTDELKLRDLSAQVVKQ